MVTFVAKSMQKIRREQYQRAQVRIETIPGEVNNGFSMGEIVEQKG